MIVRYSLANSILGPSMIRTPGASGVIGLTWAQRRPLKTAIANRTYALLMFPHLQTDNHPFAFRHSAFRYGIDGLGTGATPQIADAHGGRGGVATKCSLPWV